jgi:hypothetical protein
MGFLGVVGYIEGGAVGVDGCFEEDDVTLFEGVRWTV